MIMKTKDIIIQVDKRAFKKTKGFADQ